jgi:Protein of unknown function (DUF3237)
VHMKNAVDVPNALRILQSRPLFVMQLDVNPYQIPGATPAGFRRIGVVPGGSFVGERLHGKVLEGGNDWQFVRADGAATLDVRLVLKTHDEALIAMSYKGIRYVTAEITAKMDRGDEVDPATYYFRISPVFETAAPQYDWLNRMIGIGIGYRRPRDVLYSVFEVL